MLRGGVPGVAQISQSVASIAKSVNPSRVWLPEGPLQDRLTDQGFELGNPIFIRILKQSRELEVWIERENGEFELFQTYRICAHSGDLGPKLQEGDGQAPEGFYHVSKGALLPTSRYHRAFNLGFPNQYDRALGRTGSYLMVHGSCVSIGCYAMTDVGISEIYQMAESALQSGQPFFRVHIFPFRMTEDTLASTTDSPWFAFWGNLKEGYDYFEVHKRPPNATVTDKKYVFSE